MSCPIHPHRLESSKSTDDSTYPKSSRKRKPILCLPEVILMDVGGYKNVDDSSRLDRTVTTRSNACRLDSMKVDWNYKLDQGAKEQAPRSEHEETQA